MSADEFWKQDPELFWAYRFSFYQTQKLNRNQANHDAWLQGAYFYEAVSVALSNAFSKEQQSYRNTPYGTEETAETTPKQNIIEAKLKNRVMQVQELFRSGKCKMN